MKKKTFNILATLLMVIQGAWAGSNATGYNYVERSWDSTNKTVTEQTKTCTSYTPINGTDTSDSGWLGLYNGWYVVTGNSSYKTLNVLGTDVHLIIPDGVSLTVTGGVKLLSGHKLTIYGQSDDSGVLMAHNSYDGGAGIGGGGSSDGSAGQLVVHGGTIDATGNKYAAGIGGGDTNGFGLQSNNSGLTIYGGKVTAHGGEYAAGIGSGDKCTNGNAGYITVYGGKVNAFGGSEGAGIGGGNNGAGAMFSIYGGEVTATGGYLGAGIGGGDAGVGGQPSFYGGSVAATGGYYGAGIGGGEEAHGGYIDIYGGNIWAKGGERAAGIGGGEDGGGGMITIHSGNSIVEATGGEGGAGIGGGYNSGYGGNTVANEDGNSGTITIEGGNVTATSISSAAGIGGGIDGHYCNVTISGGTVTAISKHDGAGIGSGTKVDGSGMNVDLSITISGGTVTAYSEGHGSGIGAGVGFNFAAHDGNDIKGGEIRITGGTVVAGDTSKSIGSGAGIGSAGSIKDQCSEVHGRIIISGGDVTASSNTGAGIGPGKGCKIRDTGLISITGGTVKASSTKCSAIGRGEDVSYTSGGGSEAENVTNYSNNLGTVIITGGVVELSSGAGFPAIHLTYDKLQLGAERMVTNAGTKVGRNERVSTLRGNNPTVRVEPCNHRAVDANGSCLYCLAGPLTSISLADTDNSALLNEYNGKIVCVTLSGRTFFKDGNWNTLCLPFTLSSLSDTPLADATVMTLASSTFTNGTLTLTFEEASSIEAGKPYIVRWDTKGNDITNPVFNGVTISNTITDVTTGVVTFHGIFSPYAIESADGDNTLLYLGAGNKLYWPKAAMTIGAFHAYFQLADGFTAGEPVVSKSGNVSAFVPNFGNGEQTGIKELPIANSKPENSISQWYTIDGRRLQGQPTQPGLYISNGRKVVLK